MAIAGELMVKMAADIASLREGVRNAEQLMTGFGDKLQKLGQFVGLTVIAKQFTDFAIAAAKNAANLGEQSEQIGFNVEALQAYRAAGIQFNVSQQEMDTALTKFSVTVGKAAEGNKKLQETFDRLGVKLTDNAGQLKSNEELLQQTAKAILELDSPAKQSAATMELFSRGGTKLISVLGELSKPMAHLIEEARRQGLVVSEETSTAWDRFFDTLDVGKQRASVFVAEGLAPIIPALESLLTGTERFVRGFLKLIQELWDAIPDWIKGILRFIGEELSQFASETARLPELFDALWTDIKIVWTEGRVFFAEILTWFAELFTDLQRPVVDWANNVVDTFNKLATGLNNWANDLPEWIKKRLGVTTGVVDPLTLKFDVIGLETLEDARKAVAALNEKLEELRLHRVLQEIGIGLPLRDVPETGSLPPGNLPSPGNRGGVRPPSGGGRGRADNWQERFFRDMQQYDQNLQRIGDRMRQMVDPTFRVRQEIVQLEEAFAAGKLSPEQYEQAFDHLQRRLEEAAESGVIQRIHDLYGPEMVRTLDALEGQFLQLGESIYDAFESGEFNIRQFVGTFLREIGRMVFQMLVWTPIIQGFMNLIRGWVGGVSTGVGGAESGGGRAAGGSVVPGVAYDVGEFGRERFIPNVPGRIEPMGRSGDVNISIDMGGAMTSRGDDNRQMGELARRLRAAILDVIRNEKRPGGLLSESL